MAEAQGDYRRAFAWTVVGASAGSVARQWLQPAAPDFGRALVGIFALTAAAAVVIGILAVAPGRRVPVLAAAGGAAGSISAAAARAVTATPTQSFIGLGVFFAGAVTGLLVGMLLARAVADSERQERC
jgi:fluoride ion exporter CrcB/FEX